MNTNDLIYVAKKCQYEGEFVISINATRKGAMRAILDQLVKYEMVGMRACSILDKCVENDDYEDFLNNFPDFDKIDCSYFVSEQKLGE